MLSDTLKSVNNLLIFIAKNITLTGGSSRTDFLSARDFPLEHTREGSLALRASVLSL